jgi:hypothetical protein
VTCAQGEDDGTERKKVVKGMSEKKLQKWIEANEMKGMPHHAPSLSNFFMNLGVLNVVVDPPLWCRSDLHVAHSALHATGQGARPAGAVRRSRTNLPQA